VSATKRSFTVQTAFGRLTIPRARVERIVKDDGTEGGDQRSRHLAGDAYRRRRTQGHAARAGGVDRGRKSFWLAWNPKQNPGIDPTLRLEVRLDGEPIASYADTKTDPKDLPGATVNTFSSWRATSRWKARPAPCWARPRCGRAGPRCASTLPFPSDAPPRESCA
jgi:hypothetical protein